MTFEQLKAARAKLGLTHARFCRLIGVDASTVTRWKSSPGVPQYGENLIEMALMLFDHGLLDEFLERNKI
jgi:DNA-binding transcriptional regulator YiaG